MIKVEYELAESKHEKTRIALHQSYVFLRLTAFLKQAGYHELSTALWQALLDIVVLRPLNIPSENLMTNFEEFWDSELPRLGESIGSGWRSYMSIPKPQLPEPVTYQPQTIRPKRDIFSSFARVEDIVEKALYQPGRTLDEAGEDDPFHVILFSDLEPFLSALILTTEIIQPLVHAFLCYCQLPSLMCNDEVDYAKWWLDSFVQTWAENLWDDSNASSKWTKELPPSWRWNRMTTDLIFGEAFPDNVSVNRHWVENVLREVTHSQTVWTEIAEYFIAFELKYFGPA
jgi:hypothetical protein